MPFRRSFRELFQAALALRARSLHALNAAVAEHVTGRISNTAPPKVVPVFGSRKTRTSCQTGASIFGGCSGREYVEYILDLWKRDSLLAQNKNLKSTGNQAN
jgi:hypothetical protein